MSQNRENYDLGRDPNDVDLFLERKNKMSQNNEELIKSETRKFTHENDTYYESTFKKFQGNESCFRQGMWVAFKIKDKEIAELISVSNANIDLATKYIHEIAERDAEIEKLKKIMGI